MGKEDLTTKLDCWFVGTADPDSRTRSFKFSDRIEFRLHRACATLRSTSLMPKPSTAETQSAFGYSLSAPLLSALSRWKRIVGAAGIAIDTTDFGFAQLLLEYSRSFELRTLPISHLTAKPSQSHSGYSI